MFLLELIAEVVPAASAGFLFVVAIRLCDRLAGDDSTLSPLNLLNATLAVVGIEQLYPGNLGIDAFIALFSALAAYKAWTQRLREGRIYRLTLRERQHTPPPEDTAEQRPPERFASS